MNIKSLLLGHFDDKAFYLYKVNSILLLKLQDVCTFFNLESPHQLLESQQIVFYRDKQQPEDIYITTDNLSVIAIKHNKFLLAELCKLKQNDYAVSLADSILSNIPRLQVNKVKKDASQFKATSIELVETNTLETVVKSEPVSPPPMLSSKHSSDPMSIDTMLSHSTNGGGAGSHHHHSHTNNSKQRRLSRTLEDQPTSKKQKKTHEITILPKPAHTVSSQQTLLSKRLLNNKNTRNLTIYAPSYGEQLSNGIKSAPLNSNFRTQQQHKVAAQPHPLSQIVSRSPATATTTEFAIPPIVPSQQQPPHTAHPSSMHFPPHSPQYPSSAYGHSFPVTSGRVAEVVPPKTPTTTLQRQQFMQPFEHLFDTIETTRTLKSTLDDQIRRSSTLMQTLQASSTTIEGLVRNQIKEVQKEMLNRMEDTLDQLFQRISVLEKRLGGEEAMEEDEQEETVLKGRLVSPPTIVKSQNDIGPNEYHVMLDALRDRLDRLERQLES